jgi:hypothetical protein
MSWLQQLGGMIQQYAGISPDQAPPQVHDDFRQFAQAAPRDALAAGIAEAFRSDRTPPFEQMVGQLFGQSPPHQQAGLLNSLLGAVGPQLASQVLGGLVGGGQLSPHQAQQVSPGMVEQLAAQAHRRDPSIIDQVSGFYSQHPDLFQTLGGGALAAAMGGLAQRQGGVPAGYGGYTPAPASQDPYGDPADLEVSPASEDPYGDPADQQPAGPRW